MRARVFALRSLKVAIQTDKKERTEKKNRDWEIAIFSSAEARLPMLKRFDSLFGQRDSCFFFLG
jgi:hypothetical protein